MSSVRVVEGLEGVSPEHRPLVVQMLKKHGAIVVHRTLSEAGMPYSFRQIDAVRRVEQKYGRREPQPRNVACTDPIAGTDISKSFALNSAALHKATMRVIEGIAQREGLSLAHAMDLAHMGRDRFDAARALAA